MRIRYVLAVVALLGCESSTTTGTTCCTTGEPGARIINAFTSPVDVLIDGQVAIAALAPGAIDTALTSLGAHTLMLRPTGSGASVTQPITAAEGALSTIAAVRGTNAALASVALDDTNAVVPAGKTKVRVLHLAPNAGEIQVYRTQPDHQTPISWQFPFTYQSNPDPLSAPFFQSDVGTWEVRAWQTPADASGWANAPVKVVIPLASGEKKTVIILDKEGGGIRAEVM
jgi:Domain of unknown function (DUF4397)